MPVEAPNLGREQSQLVRELMEQALRAISGRVYSPRIKLLDMKQLREATGMSRRTIYTLMEKGDFPKPQKNSGKNLWRESAIIAWMDANDPNLEDTRKEKHL